MCNSCSNYVWCFQLAYFTFICLVFSPHLFYIYMTLILSMGRYPTTAYEILKNRHRKILYQTTKCPQHDVNSDSLSVVHKTFFLIITSYPFSTRMFNKTKYILFISPYINLHCIISHPLLEVIIMFQFLFSWELGTNVCNI